MKSGFKDPIAPKSESKQMPKDGKKSPWDFTCPEYDQRSSCFVNTGSEYGVGHRQPVGHEGNPKERASTMPMGRVKTMEVDEKA